MRYSPSVLALLIAPLLMSADGPASVLDGGWAARPWSTDRNGDALSLDGYDMTFDEEFDRFDCVKGSFAGPSGAHRWYSYGKFGFADFAPCDSGPNSPFQVRQGRLLITLANKQGRWQSGSIATMSPRGEGFRQTYGLFSARIRLPSVAGSNLKVWPAFWLLARYTRPGTSYAYSEMDVLENFGSDNKKFHATLYEWPPKPAVPGQIAEKRKKRLDVPMAIYDGQWHTYSVDWNPSWWTIYVDGKVVGRLPPQPDQLLPMYPIIDLALYKQPDLVDNDKSYTMEVDWVRVYANKKRANNTRPLRPTR